MPLCCKCGVKPSLALIYKTLHKSNKLFIFSFILLHFILKGIRYPIIKILRFEYFKNSVLINIYYLAQGLDAQTICRVVT